MVRPEQDKFRIGSLQFDPASGELRRGETLRLEWKAAAVLAELCKARGEVVSRSHLLDACWGEGDGSDEALTQAVSQIRRAIEALGDSPALIETLAKRGYRLKPAIGAPETAAATTEPAFGPRAPMAALIAGALAVIAAVLLVAWWVTPHDTRHAIRHGLNGGPPPADQARS